MEITQTSAIVLAGGRAARMGCDKAALTLRGVSFVQHQADKLRALGIGEILLSGYTGTVPGTRNVPDVYPHRGPLSGIHACLLAARNPCAVVLAVDTPLVPAALLAELIGAHRAGITLASLRGEWEPLIGVYDRALAPMCERLLQGSNTSMRALLRAAEVTALNFTGNPALLRNCNTPEDYRSICALVGL